MTGNRAAITASAIVKKFIKPLALIAFSFCTFKYPTSAQANKQLTGNWQLQKISKPGVLATAEPDEENFVLAQGAIITFNSNAAFYYAAPNSQPFSGEYLHNKKRLLLEWETADKNNISIIKITNDALVLKDVSLHIIYHFNRLQKKQADEIMAIWEQERKLRDIPPNKARIEAQKAAEEKHRQTNSQELQNN